MASLKNIKLAVFDFDDTLAVHRDKEYTKNRTDRYYEQAYVNPEIFYNKNPNLYCIDKYAEPCWLLQNT